MDASPRAGPTGPAIEAATLRDLRPGGPSCRPVLAPRHLLILITAGYGVAEVDFAPYPARPGSAVRVHPGQAVRFAGRLDAMVIGWTGDPLAEAGARDGYRVTEAGARGAPLARQPYTLPGRAHWQLTGEDEDAVLAEVSQLTADCARYGDLPAARHLLRHQLACLLLRLALVEPPPRGGPEATTFERLRTELERSYRRTRRVEDYALRLGCSMRTLTRACLAATGRSAKQVIDQRVALQAMRLLAGTDLPVAEVGRRCGFPEPTNFGRFFVRETGQTPGAFRAVYDRPPEAAGHDRPPEAAGHARPPEAAHRIVPAQRSRHRDGTPSGLSNGRSGHLLRDPAT